MHIHTTLLHHLLFLTVRVKTFLIHISLRYRILTTNPSTQWTIYGDVFFVTVSTLVFSMSAEYAQGISTMKKIYQTCLSPIVPEDARETTIEEMGINLEIDFEN